MWTLDAAGEAGGAEPGVDALAAKTLPLARVGVARRKAQGAIVQWRAMRGSESPWPPAPGFPSQHVGKDVAFSARPRPQPLESPANACPGARRPGHAPSTGRRGSPV